jgi:hypothetical protein
MAACGGQNRQISLNKQGCVPQQARQPVQHNNTRPRFHKLPGRSLLQHMARDYERRWRLRLGPARAMLPAGCVCERDGRRTRGPRECARGLDRPTLTTFPPPVRSTARARRRLPSRSRWPAPHMQSRRRRPAPLSRTSARSCRGVSYLVSFRSPAINSCSEESKRNR